MSYLIAIGIILGILAIAACIRSSQVSALLRTLSQHETRDEREEGQ